MLKKKTAPYDSVARYAASAAAGRAPKYAVVLRDVGPNEKLLKKDLQRNSGFSAGTVKALLSYVTSEGEQAVSMNNTAEEAQLLRRRLEWLGASATVEEQYFVDLWLTVSLPWTYEFDNQEIPIIGRNGHGETAAGTIDLFSVTNQFAREISEYPESQLLEEFSYFTAQDGGRVYADFSVHELPPLPGEKSILIYCSGMPCVYAALTEADCMAGKYVTLGWEDTPEKRLLLPANGQVLPAENPFRDVIEADAALFAASGEEETVEITLQLCPHCGNGTEAGSTVCPFCGAQLE